MNGKIKAYNRTKAYISLDAIAHNFEEMHKNIREDTKIIAVIKADGYGHGAVPIAHLIERKEYIWGFAVATAEEAMELRRNSIKKPILLLGYTFEEYFEEIVELDLQPTVFQLDCARKLSKLAVSKGKKLSIHIAVDTGMSRIGFRDCRESADKIMEISQLPGIRIEGLFTHFARADETDLSSAYEQLRRYTAFAEAIEEQGITIPLKHCSNSAGIIAMEEANQNAVRAGISIYGIYPSPEVPKERVKLLPAMEWKSRISYVKEVPAGEGISYGATYVTEKTLRVATIPVGYADGYPRSLSNKGHVLIHGKKAPILGRVCMDQFMVDVTDIRDAEALDEVTLLGTDRGLSLTAEELGEISGRFSYEFVCDISKRVPRIYHRGGKIVEELNWF